MSKQKKDHKFSNSRSRMIVALISSIVVIIAAGVAFYHHEVNKQFDTVAAVVSGPDIKSLPGAGNNSDEYVNNQNSQNAAQALKARKDGGSAVPTITRSNFKGNLSEFFTPDQKKKRCSMKSRITGFVPNPNSCTLKNVTLARSTGVTAEELICQDCGCPVLRKSGYTAGDMKNIGYTAKQLRDCGFTLAQLIAAGFSAKDLQEAGYTAAQLKAAGFSAKDLQEAGFTAAQLKAAGFSAKDLQEAGFTAAQLKAAGFTAAQLRAAGISGKSQSNQSHKCDVTTLKKKRMQGYTAKQLKAEGCGLAALKAAGFTAGELKAAGFGAGQLKAAGFSAKQLKDADFSAKQLHDAGFNAAGLKAAGFTAGELKAAGFGAGQLKAGGFSAGQLKDADFSAKQLHDAGFNAADLKAAGFSPEALRAGGYTKGDLLRAGLSPEEAGFGSTKSVNLCNVDRLRKERVAGVSAKTLSTEGCGLAALKAAGFSALPLEAAGFSPDQLAAAGYATKTLADNSLNAAQVVAIPSISKNSPREQLANMAAMQQKQMSLQQRQDEIAQIQAAMTTQAGSLLRGWSHSAVQAVTTPPQPKNTGENVKGSGKNQSGNTGPTGPTYKAGSIMFAVLQTAIDTDDVNTPILAKIVTGPLKGSKLIGHFNRVDTHVVIAFNLLNMPSLSKSMAINAYAIDTDTARTALSGSVNNHYMLRYGTLFASAFLKGVGDSLSSTQSQLVPGASHFLFPVEQKKPLNPTQTALVGLGQVGTTLGQNLGNIVNTPPTVKIPAGTGVGLLIMQDLTLPLANENS